MHTYCSTNPDPIWCIVTLNGAIQEIRCCVLYDFFHIVHTCITLQATHSNQCNRNSRITRKKQQVFMCQGRGECSGGCNPPSLLSSPLLLPGRQEHSSRPQQGAEWTGLLLWLELGLRLIDTNHTTAVSNGKEKKIMKGVDS